MKEEKLTHKRIMELKHDASKRLGVASKEMKRLAAIQRMGDLRLEHEKEQKEEKKKEK